MDPRRPPSDYRQSLRAGADLAPDGRRLGASSMRAPLSQPLARDRLGRAGAMVRWLALDGERQLGLVRVRPSEPPDHALIRPAMSLRVHSRLSRSSRVRIPCATAIAVAP